MYACGKRKHGSARQRRRNHCNYYYRLCKFNRARETGE